MSDLTPKHQKITTYAKQPDESVKIETRSYYEKLSHELIEIEKSWTTTFETLKEDVDATLHHLVEDHAQQLVITIKIVDGRPKMTKRYITLKKNYPRF